MAGGRPPAAGRVRDPALEELRQWFTEALADAGYPNPNVFLSRERFDKNRIYEIAGGLRLPSLKLVRDVAAALGRESTEVEPILLRAKETIERRQRSISAEHESRVTSWVEVHDLEPGLQDLVEALAGAVEELPYRLLGIGEPDLSTVYVRQRMRQKPGSSGDVAKKDERQEGNAGRVDPPGAESTVSLAEALNRNDHLLITGEPGVGKSMLGNHLISLLAKIWLHEETAAKAPLDEPVIPLRVPARAFALDRSWSEMLTEAMGPALGSRLDTRLDPHLFTRRPHNVRWLVVVDGLDEVLDRSTRASIIRRLAQRARADSGSRFVITTRPLPKEELAPLLVDHVGQYQVEPFGPAELREFAHNWFAERDRLGHLRAAEFLRQVEDSRLRELVRNPLLATIAAMVYTIEPDRPLPTKRIDLYERFYKYLVSDEEVSGRETLSELRRFEQSNPPRYRLAAWIHERRTRLIGVLARERMDRETLLHEVAAAWVRENKPADMPLPEGWDGDLKQLLIDTGMFVYESEGVRFLHHSFAEFLAADAHAAAIPGDFPRLDDWIERGSDEQRTFVLFTFALWGRREGNDIGLILRHLLDGGSDRVHLAGHLLAEASDICDDADSITVVNRLVALALGAAPEETGHGGGFWPLGDMESTFGVLARLVGNEHATSRLDELAARRELTTTTRVHAVRALGSVARGRETVTSLTELADSGARHDELLLIAECLKDIEADPKEKTRSILLSVGRAANASPRSRLEATRLLMKIQDIDAAVEAARLIVLDRRAEGAELASAAELFFANADPASVDELVDAMERLPGQSPAQRVRIAEELRDGGHAAAAVRVARTIVTDRAAGRDEVAAAVAYWRSAGGEGAVPEILAVVKERPALEPWIRFGLVGGSVLREKGTPASAEDAAEVIAVAEDTPGMKISDRLDMAQALAEGERSEPAIRLARGIITDHAADGSDIGGAVEVWLSAAGESDVVEEILTLAQDQLAADAWARARVARIFAEAGHTDMAISLARSVIADLSADAYDVGIAIEGWLSAAGSSALGDVIAAVDNRQVIDAELRASVADTLADLGHRAAARRLALRSLTDVSAESSMNVTALDVLLRISGVAAVDEALPVLRSRAISVEDRMTLAERLSSAGALSAAAGLWLDLLTAPDVSPADCALVSARLVQSGHREQTMEALRAALLAGDISVTMRARLRASLAWVTLSDPETVCCGLCAGPDACGCAGTGHP